MRNFLKAIGAWLKDSWKAMKEASLYTDDFVNGKVGVFPAEMREQKDTE